MRKQKGFSLIELLIVVAIILIIAAIAIPNLMRARIAANESAGASTVRTLNTAEVTYSTTYASMGYAPSLTVLGPGAVDCTVPSNVTSANACLIDGVLGTTPFTKGAFVYNITSSVATAPVPDYMITAKSLGTAMAKKDYCSNTDAVVRFQVENNTPGSVPASATACNALSAIQ
jgi:prepilin-type N-terminal cleavage/methylation domain-containing protein